MTKFIKRATNAEYNKNLPKPESGYSQCCSFNDQSTFDENTQFLIVGTLTPREGRKAGYFYCSKRNQQYRYIDRAFGIDSLEKYKDSLIDLKQEDGDKRKEIIDKVKGILKERHIAFLDVIKEANASNTDPSDDSIIDFSLDYDSFDKYYPLLSKVKIVANSKNALYALKVIFAYLEKKHEEDASLLETIANNIPVIHNLPRAERAKDDVLTKRWISFFTDNQSRVS